MVLIVRSFVGYTELGLGPLPTDPSRRRRLGQLLDLVEADKGELVFDLELVLVADDENDQGYVVAYNLLGICVSESI